MRGTVTFDFQSSIFQSFSFQPFRSVGFLCRDAMGVQEFGTAGWVDMGLANAAFWIDWRIGHRVIVLLPVFAQLRLITAGGTFATLAAVEDTRTPCCHFAHGEQYLRHIYLRQWYVFEAAI